MQSLLLTIALIALLVVYKRLEGASKDDRKRAMRTALVYCAVAVVIVLAISGKLNPLIALAVTIIPLALRALSAWSLFRRIAHRKPTVRRSEVRGRFIELYFDHGSGVLGGRVTGGEMAGHDLKNLTEAQLFDLLDFCCTQDPRSGALLQAFLDQTCTGWGRRYGKPGVRKEAIQDQGVGMTMEEASAVLGVPVGSPRAAVISAHKRLMQKLHPDRGGSHYLATQVNVARETLLAGDSQG